MSLDRSGGSILKTITITFIPHAILNDLGDLNLTCDDFRVSNEVRLRTWSYLAQVP